MIFLETTIAGAWIIEPERHNDERGFFARIWDTDEFAACSLSDRLVQASVSFNRRRGTLRGMHYQASPHAEAKLVRCTAGAVFDVAVDLRSGSATLQGWFGVELSAENHLALYVPEGCAHGFITLTDAAEVSYLMSAPYVADSACGVRFDDPSFDIDWPIEVVTINDRDRSYPDFALEAERKP